MPQVVPAILSQLLMVIVQQEVCSPRTHGRAVHIFNTISSFIFHMSYTFPVRDVTVVMRLHAVFPLVYLKQGGPPCLILKHQRKWVEVEAII